MNIEELFCCCYSIYQILLFGVKLISLKTDACRSYSNHLTVFTLSNPSAVFFSCLSGVSLQFLSTSCLLHSGTCFMGRRILMLITCGSHISFKLKQLNVLKKEIEKLKIAEDACRANCLPWKILTEMLVIQALSKHEVF